jgi:hypothetical protein
MRDLQRKEKKRTKRKTTKLKKKERGGEKWRKYNRKRTTKQQSKMFILNIIMGSQYNNKCSRTDRRTRPLQTHLWARILFIENGVCHRLTQSRQIALGVKQILNTPWLTYSDYYANVLRATQFAIHATQVPGPQWRIYFSLPWQNKK